MTIHDHPPGLLGVIAQDTARYSMFAMSITGLSVPYGTKNKWVIGHNIAASMNELADALLTTDDCDWLLILNDDHSFDDDLLGRLLSHGDLDIVAPLCLTRMPPYEPVLFSGWHDGNGEKSKMRWRVRLDDHPDGGLIRVHSAGTAGMLVRRRVFEMLPRPWFEVGQVHNEHVGEDVYFCDKAREAGFGLYADLDAPLGHCTTATVWPANEEGGWTYGFEFTGGLRLNMPPGSWDAVVEESDKQLP